MNTFDFKCRVKIGTNYNVIRLKSAVETNDWLPCVARENIRTIVAQSNTHIINILSRSWINQYFLISRKFHMFFAQSNSFECLMPAFLTGFFSSLEKYFCFMMTFYFSLQNFAVQRKCDDGIFRPGQSTVQRHQARQHLSNYTSNDIQREEIRRPNEII